MGSKKVSWVKTQLIDLIRGRNFMGWKYTPWAAFQDAPHNLRKRPADLIRGQKYHELPNVYMGAKKQVIRLFRGRNTMGWKMYHSQVLRMPS